VRESQKQKTSLPVSVQKVKEKGKKKETEEHAAKLT